METDSTCLICYEDDGEFLPRCNHRYHLECLSTWFKVKKEVCPLCSGPISQIQLLEDLIAKRTLSFKADSVELFDIILYLKSDSSDVSIDATFIIESEKFKGVALKKYLNVAIVYFLKKQLLPFTAFMKRFQYAPECYDCLAKGTLKENKKKLMSQFPFLTLILIIARDISIIKDPMARMCIKILLETQKSALSCNEIIYMDIWLRNRDSGFIFLETYFSLYSGKSIPLVTLLTNQNYKGPKTPTIIQKILVFPTFNVNVRIPYHPKDIYNMCPQNKIRDHPFYVILLLEHTLSRSFLFSVLKDSRLVKSVPTGSLYIYLQVLDEWVHLSNRSPLFLALIFGNIWSKLHMFLNSSYYEIFVFIFQYFVYSSQLIYIIIIHILKSITKVNK